MLKFPKFIMIFHYNNTDTLGSAKTLPVEKWNMFKIVLLLLLNKNCDVFPKIA